MHMFSVYMRPQLLIFHSLKGGFGVLDTFCSRKTLLLSGVLFATSRFEPRTHQFTKIKNNKFFLLIKGHSAACARVRDV